MKTFASMMITACLCACSSPDRGPAQPEASAAAASATRTRAVDAMPAADSTILPSDGNVTTPSAPLSDGNVAPEPSPSPADKVAPTIAVGEPHPTQSNGPTRQGPARYDGYGDLRFGMDEKAARAAWNAPLKGDKVETGNCVYLHGLRESAPAFMFEGGRFVRYDVRDASEIAPGGGHAGITRAQLEALYPGRVDVKPHHYVQGGHYLRVADPASKNRALVFETDETGKITGWRAGQGPQVDYVEGCS